MSVRNLNTGAKKRIKLGLALEQSAKEILAHVKGEAKLPTRRVVVPDEIDVKRIDRSQSSITVNLNTVS